LQVTEVEERNEEERVVGESRRDILIDFSRGLKGYSWNALESSIFVILLKKYPY
jgi:hypothetical protein